MNTTRNIAIGIIAGVAVGAALGMLYAPHSGTTTRRMIRRKGEAFADGVNESIESIESIADKFESLKNEVQSRLHM